MRAIVRVTDRDTDTDATGTLLRICRPGYQEREEGQQSHRSKAQHVYFPPFEIDTEFVCLDQYPGHRRTPATMLEVGGPSKLSLIIGVSGVASHRIAPGIGVTR